MNEHNIPSLNKNLSWILGHLFHSSKRISSLLIEIDLIEIDRSDITWFYPHFFFFFMFRFGHVAAIGITIKLFLLPANSKRPP